MKRDPVYLSEHASLRFLDGFDDRLNRLMAILESSFDGIYITDGEANTIWCNRSYEVVSGLSPEEVIGKNMRDLVQDGIISSSGTLLALERLEPVTIDQAFKTGKQAIVTSTPIFDRPGNVIMVVTNVRDVSELYSLKEELEKSRHLTQRYQAEIELIRRQIDDSMDFVAVDRSTLELLHSVQRVARMDTAVLLLGETGVGKERFADYIHENSPRKGSPFIKVNCGAIAENLVESELFGYEGGAFTGAKQGGRPGLFEVADKGTIFLDEVGDLPQSAQVKLLRVLQEQELTRVGSNTPIKIDVRVLAATNRDLNQMALQGTFRADLLYRLNVFPVTIPPLRARKNDIPALAQNMLSFLNRKYGKQKSLSQSAMAALLEYQWPGNIRELRNVIERAFIMSEGDVMSLATPGLHTIGEQEYDDGTVDLKAAMERMEAGYILRACRSNSGVRAAARSLHMDPATFIRKRDKYRSLGLL